MGTENRAAWAVADVAIAALSAPDGTASLMTCVLEALRTALGADVAGFYEHQQAGFSLPLYLSPADVWQRIPYGRTPTALAASMHPGVRHLLSNRPVLPFSLTDVVSERVVDFRARPFDAAGLGAQLSTRPARTGLGPGDDALGVDPRSCGSRFHRQRP